MKVMNGLTCFVYRFRDQDVGTPESCDHVFCLECLQEWSKVCIILIYLILLSSLNMNKIGVEDLNPLNCLRVWKVIPNTWWYQLTF